MNDLLSPMNVTIDEVRKHPLGYSPQASGPGAGGGPGRGGGGGNSDDRGLTAVFSSKSGRLDSAPFLPQGKVAIYNTSFEAEGFSPMPEWREPPESVTGTPTLAEKYPLTLSDYHTSKCYSASWQRNVPYLREVQPYPMLHIHPDTAAARGIKNDDWVIVEGVNGWMKVKAEIYPGIRPDTVMVLHGWWQGCSELGFEDFPIADGGANVNNMYSTDPETSMDPLVTANSSQALVEVRKA
jgi:anaerobic selenocysteine-containing dehydrogenase